ncbi:hypothetical protein V2J09_021895 [Rumex salicifolius]
MAALTRARSFILSRKSNLASNLISFHGRLFNSPRTNPNRSLGKSEYSFFGHRFESTKAQCSQNAGGYSDDDYEERQVLDSPIGKVKLTSKMSFLPESSNVIDCYRILNEDGRLYRNFPEVGKELALKIYTNMITLRVMDTLFYEAQRQGRIPFYATTTGEEAINIATAAALSIDDIVFPQYREPGVLMWRGFTLQEFADQCFSNKGDNTKGRQMAVHYGSRDLNYVTVAATVGTQIPHAVGAAYSLKMDKKNACAVTFFGDGGTSTGDFHAALNFAAVLEAPVLFICRNNGWAISTPVADQLRSDGIVVKGQAYGVRSIRVDGNDALALYDAISAARKMAINEHRPILIEALTYRVGHHTTSDDSTRYRPSEEIESWRKTRDPVTRFRKWIEGNNWWNEGDDSELRSNIRMQVLRAIQAAEKLEKPPLFELFTDVYDVPPLNLVTQEISLRKDIQKHPRDYPTNVPV